MEQYENLSGFFRQSVNTIVKTKGIKVPEDVELHIVELLSKLDAQLMGASLVEMQIEAQQKAEASIYQKVGDKALATTSLFEMALTRHNISETYVEDVGIAAYTAAGSIAKRSNRAQLYRHMSRNFHNCKDILKYFRETTTLGLPEDPIELLEYYRKTKSKEAYLKLRSLDILVLRIER